MEWIIIRYDLLIDGMLTCKFYYSEFIFQNSTTVTFDFELENLNCAKFYEIEHETWKILNFEDRRVSLPHPVHQTYAI
jgi:hypothetical protein